MTTSETKGLALPAVPRPPLPEPGEEVVEQSHEAVTRTPEDRSGGCFGLITYLEYRQSRVVNAMDDLVNVVNGVVVDASVYAFAAQTVTLVFASLSIFSANLFLPAIVDESCTLLSTSVRIGALRVVRIDPSNGDDTSSARTLSPTVLPA